MTDQPTRIWGSRSVLDAIRTPAALTPRADAYVMGLVDGRRSLARELAASFRASSECFAAVGDEDSALQWALAAEMAERAPEGH